jgi:signal transduction histidine kinase
LTRIVPSVSLAASAIVAAVAVAAIVATSPAVRDGANGGVWALSAGGAAAIWSLTIALWAVAARRPTLDRSLAPVLSGALGAVAPTALFVLAMPAVDHPIAIGWLWIWSFALAAESLVHSIASGRVTVDPVTLWRDGCVAVGAIGTSLAFERIDLAWTSVLVAAAIALSWMLSMLIRAALRQHQRAIEAERSEAEAAERRRRANWIHDELLSELRLARLRLETAEGGTRQALSELIDIEHRLRIRQLDAELESGGTRLAEIVQPFVRMVTGAGCRVDGVPSSEVAGTWIHATAGYELKRFFGVAVPNALLAGASLVVFEVELDGRRLVVRIRDDAGGFDPEQVQVGRGRERLERELGPERLSTLVDPIGTTFSCEFELDL